MNKIISIECFNPSKIVCYDLETTGTNPKFDEILQISAIDGDGTVLLNTYVKPRFHTSWPFAERVNHISVIDVTNAPTIDQLLPQIQGIFNSAKTIVGYNHRHFDNHFLSELGIEFNQDSFQDDVMIDYAKLVGQRNKNGKGLKCFKLVECAEHFNYAFDPHDSLADAKATLYCFKKIQELKYR